MPYPTLLRRSPAPLIPEGTNIAKMDERAAEHEAFARLMREVLDALSAADPKPMFRLDWLDPTVPVEVRYEPGRWRYAIYTTDATGTKVQVQALGTTWTIQTSAPGWVALDLPGGTRLWSGDANRHAILVRASNLMA